MIESIMYFGMAFLFAAVSVLVAVALVHRRTGRLTARQLETAIPPSKVENQGQKDLPRSDFATSTRGLEKEVEQLQAKCASQLAELDNKRDTINRLQIELDDLRQQLRATEEEFAHKATAMQETERTLSDKESKLARVMTELDERSALVDAQKIEIIALKTQVEANVIAMQEAERTLSEKESKLAKLMAELDERSALNFDQEIAIIALKTQVQAIATARQEAKNALSEMESKLAKLMAELDEWSTVADTQQIEMAALENQVQVLKEQLDGVSNELKAVESRRDAERIEMTQELMEERSKFNDFHCRVADLVQRVVLQATEERQAQDDLENRLADQSTQFNEREFEIEQLRSEIKIARKSGADLRVVIDEVETRDKTAIQNLEAETEKLRAALDRANGERMRLTYELANMKRQGNCAA
jgi:chromosome segregation ATPase